MYKVETFQEELILVKQEYKKATSYRHCEPLVYLMMSRRIVENICRQLVAYGLFEEPKEFQFQKYMRKLEDKSILPRRILAAFWTVKNYGNFGAHAPLGADAKNEIQSCADSLATIVGWYVGSYRPADAIVFTSTSGIRQELQKIREDFYPTIDLNFQIFKDKVVDTDLLQSLREKSKTFQPIPHIFIFDREEHPETAGNENVPRDWGNNVYSLSQIRFETSAQILECIQKTIKKISAQAQEGLRRIDAAVPAQAERDRNIELLIQVRFPDSPLLNSEDWPTRQKPEQIEQQSKALAMNFPKDRVSGDMKPVQLQLKITAPDFAIHGDAEKLLDIPYDRFSETIIVPLSPLKDGPGRIYIEIYHREENPAHLGSIVLESTIDETGTIVSQTGHSNILFDLQVGASEPERHVPTQEAATAVFDDAGSRFVPDIKEMLKLNRYFLGNAENKELAENVCEKVLQEYAPNETESEKAFIPSLLAQEASRKKITPVSADISGGLGVSGTLGQDVSLAAIVPAVVAVLSSLFRGKQKSFLQKFSNKTHTLAEISKVAAMQTLREEDIRHIIEGFGIHLTDDNIRRLTETIRRIIVDYLEREHE